MNLEGITIKEEKATDVRHSGRFVVEPLPAGYGMTLGTALRRVLLSSLPGGAIAEVRFTGVPHPFMTIKGVKEDVVELLLNLKRVRFKLHGEGPYEGTISAKGKKVITAADIKLSSEVSIANTDLKIATLTDKSAELSATVIIEKGIGYKPAEERQGERVGVIPMDSVFSPVTKVGFWVKEIRVGRKANLDQLLLEITTDGTIKPSEALVEAAKILRDYFDRLTDWKVRPSVKEKPETSEKTSPRPDVRKLEVTELALPPRVTNVLEEAGIKTVGGLLQKSEEDLLSIKGFGANGLTAIKRELKKLDTSLKG